MLILITNILIACVICFTNGQQISTPQGDIKGFLMKSVNGREFYAYLGVPYAKPPVGELRLSNPVPFGKWTGVKDGSKEGSQCIQGNFLKLTEVVGSEDCLYLNVFSNNPYQEKKHPVLVFIHGGAFHAGSGMLEYYGPDILLDKDIVLVCINYRLGALGFASTEDTELPGNYGLKDQVLALKWVQENILSYGGDPGSVTIMGESAGAASVHYLMISPLAKGLFHRAIPMSGSSHCPWATSPPGLIAERTRKLAKLLGCTSTSIVECFRKQNPEKFINLMPNFVEWDIDPLIVFSPVVEPKEVEGAFLAESPFTIKTHVPMLTGITSDEGVLRTALFHSTGGLELRMSQLNENFDEIGPVTLMFDKNTKNSVDMARKVKEFYFGEHEINVNVVKNVTDMYTDAWFLKCATSIVRTHEGPAFLYLFGYRGKHSVADFLSTVNVTIDYGVSHGDDLIYFFPLNKYNSNDKYLKGSDKDISNMMVNLWTNFISYGNPTPPGSDIKWDNVSKDKMNYLSISTLSNSKMTDGLYGERDAFWQNLEMNVETEAGQKSEL